MKAAVINQQRFAIDTLKNKIAEKYSEVYEKDFKKHKRIISWAVCFGLQVQNEGANKAMELHVLVHINGHKKDSVQPNKLLDSQFLFLNRDTFT